MSGGGSGMGGLSPSLEGAESDQLVPVEERERQFGRYQLRYEIASGGMATVYLARSKGPAGFDRALAVKRIHPHLAKKKDFVEMFLDEARLSARINHPNVCSVFDFGEVDGTYFMAMEYLVGQPLSALLRALHRRPELASSLRWRVLAAKIVADACEGLHAAHELTDERGRKLGVVHRDCSPHNVFVTYDGAVKVVDFGVAFAEGRLHQTQTGALKGKLGYMSPEQVRGKDIDRRLDIWTLGVLLWELLTIKRLFGKRQEVELIQAVVNQPLVPPSTVRPGIPAELDRITMKALQRDPTQRFPTARAMARELNAFVSSSGVSAGLADLSELMEELFAQEREAKLGVVASVLETGSDVLAMGTQSGPRIVLGDVTGVTPAPFVPAPVPASRPAISVPPLSAPPAAPPPASVSAPMAFSDPTPLPTPVPRIESSAPTVAPVLQPASSATPTPPPVLFAAAPATFSTPPAMPATSAPPPAPMPAPRPAGSSGWVLPALGLALLGIGALAGVGYLASNERPAVSVQVAPAPTPDPPSALAPPPSTALEVPPSSALAPEATPPSTHVRPGTIAISVTGGWADIYIDGTLRGRTPRQLQVPAGRHVVELRPSGEAPGTRHIVNVRSGATSRVTAALGE